MKSYAALFASVAALAFAAPSHAVPARHADTVDTSLPTQLPRTAIPHHYAITVTPHAERLTFDGSVGIDLDVIKPTSTLVLNAADMKLVSATVRPARAGAPLPARISLDPKAETATLAFGRTLAPGAYHLAITYTGQIHTQANGLFALDYKDLDGKDARSLFTQFEAADARRFFPGWDEPDYKATFDLTARVPADTMAVGNMPALSSKPLAGGLKEVRFQTTPIMSTYLLFFGDGDFDRITKPSAGGEVGVVMSRGNGPKGQLALDAEAEILPYYNQYFGTPFPLPKLDNVAGPGASQFFSAMENWGAIFTFERSLLVDPAITSEADRQRVFGTEAHEMAHQWFGDLVTMGWWGDLWLNEGFASWMATKATEHFHPDWGADIDRVGAREGAIGQDAFQSTHPIVQDVRTVEQANQAFDTITYSKGESVLSMLEGFAGPDVWQRGIQAYIRAHAYQNTKTQDLWNAIEGAGAKGLSTVARDFTDQPGVPLIEVGPAQCQGGQTVATLTQSQFSDDQRAEVTAHPLSWHVPVRASAGGAQAQVVTQGPTTQIAIPGCGPLLINAGQTGYYRTLYQPAQAQALQGAFVSLGPVDQYGLVGDQLSLSEAGYQPFAVGLDFLNQVPANGNAKLVQSAVRHWSGLYDDLHADPAAQAAIANRVIRVYGPRLKQLGFTPRDGEPVIDALLRSTLIGTLGKFKDPTVRAEAGRLFTAWQADSNAIPGSLKETWLGVIARNADEPTWNAIHAKAQAATAYAERSSLYRLLGATTNDALAQRALDLALTSEPGKTTSAGIIGTVADQHPRMAVDFVLAHLAQVNDLIDISGRSRFMERLSGGSDDASLIPILDAYAKTNLAASDRKPVDEAINVIRFEAGKLPRERSEVEAWLATHPA
ncbi:MAG TPA: M1 family metallopeptidase [Sphingomicrobium sp.]